MLDLKELSGKYKFSEDSLRHLKAVYGSELEKVIQALRSPGKRYYFRVNTLKARNPEEVMGNLREKGFKVEQHPNIKEALYVPVEGPFEIKAFNKKVMVDKFTAESVLQGAHVYALGIKRCSKIRRGDSVTVVDEFNQAIASGIARMGETEILSLRKGLAIEIFDSKYRVPSLRETEEFKNGLIYPQSFPAIIACRVLDPKPYEEIADIAAAPGGKTGAIAQLMQNKGTVYAVDRNKIKIGKLNETIGRLGITNVKLICHDARYFDKDFPDLKFQKALIDPPCSSLGVRPKIYENCTSSRIHDLSEYQKQFISSISNSIKPGGTIVYSTCTLTIEENEEIVKFAVDVCKLKVMEQDYFFGSPGLAQVIPEAALTQRFNPHIHEDCPGFFIAKFVK
ncbi:MAG: PUA domain-containing protein [Candidatus Bathyarchaeia archaeon]